MFAAGQGHERVVELLLQRGAEIDLHAFAVLLVDISAAPYPQVDHPLVAVEGGAYQRGEAAAALQVDLRAVPQQQLDHPLVALVGGAHQQREAAHLATLVRRIDSPAAVKQHQHRLLLASLSCCNDLIGDCRGTARRPPHRHRWR